jgi:hypothetical protein
MGLRGLSATLAFAISLLLVGATMSAAAETRPAVHPAAVSSAAAVANSVSEVKPETVCEPGGPCGTWAYFEPGEWWIVSGHLIEGYWTGDYNEHDGLIGCIVESGLGAVVALLSGGTLIAYGLGITVGCVGGYELGVHVGT